MYVCYIHQSDRFSLDSIMRVQTGKILKFFFVVYVRVAAFLVELDDDFELCRRPLPTALNFRTVSLLNNRKLRKHSHTKTIFYGQNRLNSHIQLHTVPAHIDKSVAFKSEIFHVSLLISRLHHKCIIFDFCIGTNDDSAINAYIFANSST